MGNHERGEVDRQVRLAMQRTGVRLLEHQTDTLWKGTEFICWPEYGIRLI